MSRTYVSAYPDLMLSISATHINPFEDKNLVPKKSPRAIASSVIVSGQPGIVKTLCLYFVHVLRLAAKLPTFFPLECYYFSGGCVEKRTAGDAIGDIALAAQSVWWLFDPKVYNIAPSGRLIGGGRFILHTTSPRKERLDWKAICLAPFAYYMELWSDAELICAYADFSTHSVLPYTDSVRLTMRRLSTTKPIAELLYAHIFLRGCNEWTLYPISLAPKFVEVHISRDDRSSTGTTQRHGSLRQTLHREHISVNADPSCYYVPSAKNQATSDAFVQERDVVPAGKKIKLFTVFQMTVVNEHDVEPAGLNWLKTNDPHACIRYIAVTPSTTEDFKLTMKMKDAELVQEWYPLLYDIDPASKR
ncbi:hypothetical protein BC835DRAFT_1410151 [Cytidiella melzeri]|nr:hypothetical protein BC835DRAFT_1410151 [Cytidiella melzeri]